MTLAEQLQAKLEQLIRERDAALEVAARANGAIEAVVWTIQALQGRISTPNDRLSEVIGDGNRPDNTSD